MSLHPKDVLETGPDMDSTRQRAQEAYAALETLMLDDDSRTADELSSIGMKLWKCHHASGQLDYLEKALIAVRRAVYVTPKGQERPVVLKHICLFLCERFAHLGDPNDLEEAVTTGHSAVELASDDDPDLFIYLNTLGRALQARYDHLGKPDDLQSAISLHARALELAPDTHVDTPRIYSNLGTALYDRFQRTGRVKDIHNAITAHRSAVELAPDGQSNKVAYLNDLCSVLQNRFERLGNPDDLESAIMTLRSAIQIAPDGHSRKPNLLDRLGMTLHLRFDHLGHLDDLEDAIAAHRRAYDLLPQGHVDKSGPLSNVGLAMQARYDCSGKLVDLEEVISVLRQAISIPPANHRFKPLQLGNLGSALRSRFERLGELDDLENAILAHRRVVDLTPNNPSSFNNLGTALQHRFKRLNVPEDLEAAISAKRQAVEMTPDAHPRMPTRLISLGGALAVRYQTLKELTDLEDALQTLHRADELLSMNHPNKPDVLTNLGGALQLRFDSLHELDDLENAISAHRHAVDLTPGGRASRPYLLANLAIALRSRFEYDQTQSNFDAAVAGFLDATDQKLGSPLQCFQYALRCVGMFLKYPSFGSPGPLLEVYSRVLHILPEVIWIGHSVHRRYEESARVGVIVNGAVTAAIDAGDMRKAVEWLEEGRVLVWSQILTLRTPLDNLDERHPDLANALREVVPQMQHMGISTRLLGSDSIVDKTPTDFPEIDEVTDRRRHSAIQYEQILAEVRRCEGFEDFLRPKKFEYLAASPCLLSGLVVFLNVDETRCDALAISSGGILTHVSLPKLTLERARKLSSMWKSCLEAFGVRERALVLVPHRRGQYEGPGESGFRFVLEKLWSWIVYPVLRALNFMSKARDSIDLPHITWCPTGPLTQLPLHAAGIYDGSESQQSGLHIFDFVVSSYTPSLTLLMRLRDEVSPKLPTSNLLVITQPATPGQSLLPGTYVESARISTVLPAQSCTFLDHDQATVEATLAAITQHPWVHFACHGFQDVDDPTQSAFALFDGRLSLATLMNTTADNGELAFLSACQTAVGDEMLPEESAHLAAAMLVAGFKGVVATMWSIKDEDAPTIVEAYYKALLELRKTKRLSDGETGAAYALHDAARTLREKAGESNFERWVPFVHFGM